MQDYAERRSLRAELRALQKEERKRQERAVTEVVRSAQVVTPTSAFRNDCTLPSVHVAPCVASDSIVRSRVTQCYRRVGGCSVMPLRTWPVAQLFDSFFTQ